MLKTETLTPEHEKFLIDRKITPATCMKLGVHSQSGALVFPYLNGKSEMLFSKHRSHDKRFWLSPGGSELRAWNLQNLASASKRGGAKTLVICEGEFDVLACIEAGWPVDLITSVPNGAPNVALKKGEIVPHDDKAFNWMWLPSGDLRPELAQFQKFIIFTDNDPAGLNLRNNLMIRLGQEKCYLPVYPAGCKDANEILIQLGAPALFDVLVNVFPLVPDVLTPIDDIPETVRTERYLSGWSDLNKHLVICPPELIVITGRPGSGKSTFALSLGLNMARLYGAPGAVIQFEDDIERTRYEIRAYVRTWKTSPPRDVTDPITGEVTRIPNYTQDPNFTRTYVRVVPPAVDEDDARNLEWLRATIHEAACRHGCKWVIIDPWNEIEHIFDKNFREDQYINNALRALKGLARRYKIALMIVAHPDKSGGRHESVDEMSLYSIAGGAAWKNKADHGIIVDREKDGTGYTGNTIIKIDKSKNHRDMGEPGQATLAYDRDRNLFYPAKK